MDVVITGADSLLGRALASSLAETHHVRPLDLAEITDPTSVRRALEGAGAIVHLLPICLPTTLAPEAAIELVSRGTYVLLTEAAEAGVPRVVLASTLDLMEAYPPGWNVEETWQPRPSTQLAELAPYLAERSASEVAHDSDLQVICLRFGRLVDDSAVAAGVADSRCLHVIDAVQAVQRALSHTADDAPRRPWQIFHVSAGEGARFPLRAARRDLGFEPAWRFEGAARPESRMAALDERGTVMPARTVPSRPVRRITVYGGCGPLAAAAFGPLAAAYVVRLADVLSPQEGAARIAARFPDAHQPPAPELPAPHEFRRADIGDPAAVSEAASGVDALMNCSVVREDLEGAFRVNTVGAYNVMRAALAHGIRRVVHTGPQVLNFGHRAGYAADFGLPDEAPMRAGTNLYFHTKLLGLEICRIFAEEQGLEVAVLLFSAFANPRRLRPRPLPLALVSWDDAGIALRRAVEVPSLPSPFEVLRILGDLPLGKFTNSKAKRVLGWAPRDALADVWHSTNDEKTTSR